MSQRHYVSTPGMAPQALVDAIHNPYAYMRKRLKASHTARSDREVHCIDWDPASEDVKKLRAVLEDILEGAVQKKSTSPATRSTLYTLYPRSQLGTAGVFEICEHGCIHARTPINIGFTDALHECAKVVQLAWAMRDTSVSFDGKKAFHVPTFNPVVFRGINSRLLPNDMLACRMYAWACGPLFRAARGQKVPCCDVRGHDMVTPYIDAVEIIYKTRGDWRFRISWQDNALRDIEWLCEDTKAVMGLYRDGNMSDEPVKLGYLVAETFYDMINEHADVREAERQGPRALVVQTRAQGSSVSRLLGMLQSPRAQPARQPSISEEKNGQEEGEELFMEGPDMSLMEPEEAYDDE